MGRRARHAARVGGRGWPLRAACAAGLAALVWGCASDPKPSGGPLSATNFRGDAAHTGATSASGAQTSASGSESQSTLAAPTSPSARIEAQTPPPAPSRPIATALPPRPVSAAPPAVVSPEPGPRPITDAVAVPGAPSVAAMPAAKAVGLPVVVDSVVGQINGKPVFASDVMNRLGARLNRLAIESKSREQFISGAAKLIGQDLQEQISSELFLAEARASLTPEQRQGLLQLVTNIQANIAAMNQGAALQADERLLAEQGKTLEDMAKEERDKMLIRVLVNRHIVPRVNVSWRDVEKAYDRMYDQYNPPATATLRLVRVPSANAERVQKVTEALAAGKPFVDIAKDRALNDFNAGEGGQIVTEVKGPMAEATLLPDPALNVVARALSVGGVSEPVKSGQWTSWIYLEKVERQPGVPLQDAQLEIYRALSDARFRAEYQRFVRKLEEAGSKTDIVEMATRLVEIAAARYYTPLNKREGAPAAPALSPTRTGGGS